MANETNQKITDYQITFGSPEGKRVLADLDAKLLYRRDIFDDKSGVNSARVTDFNLGKNTAIRYIHEWIEKPFVKDEPAKQVRIDDIMEEGVKNE